MRLTLTLIALLSLAVAIGCGGNQPPATVYVTMPQTVRQAEASKPNKPPAGRPAEAVKPADPWEEARAYFKKVKETEKEKTEAKLKSIDKPTEVKLAHLVRLCREQGGYISSGTYPSSIGQELWTVGLTEFIESQSSWVIDDKQFQYAFKKLNPNPSTHELVTAATRFAVTHFGIRELTLQMIEKGEDTRDRTETHRAATAWTGK